MAERVKKVQGIKVDPEIFQLAENEVAISFMEHPELEMQVKNKIADVIESKSERQIVEVEDAIKFLKRNLGNELASILCSATTQQFNSYLKGTKKPSIIQTRSLGVAFVISDILLSRLTRLDVMDWFTSYSEYLAGVPAIEIQSRPEDVRMAALHRITVGRETPNVY
jgi:hypothetical protein